LIVMQHLDHAIQIALEAHEGQADKIGRRSLSIVSGSRLSFPAVKLGRSHIFMTSSRREEVGRSTA